MYNRTKIIDIIQSIWSDELETKNFSSEDDFFELGGNSLKLLAVLDKLQKSKIGQKLSTLTVLDLFDNPTINKLTSLLESKLSNAETTKSTV